MISINDFKKMEIKIATIVEVKDHPNADKLYLLTINLGTEQRQIVAGIKKHYSPEELLNKNIVVVTNLEPATIRGIESKGMLLAAQGEDNIVLLTTDKSLFPGAGVR
ncbi:MAG: methionine--tRNA ligase subunit beta [Candidatus Omnitrophota bacterium]